MNRREFLKSLFAAGLITAADPTAAIEQILTATEKLSDESFICYIKYTATLYVDNPSRCGYIDGVS